VCVTGAALVFRIDMQRALHSDLFTATDGPPADAATILDSLRDAYPNDRVSFIDAPSTARPTYLGYVQRGQEYLPVLIDPVSARVLGEVPDRSFVTTLQDLHFDLLAGRTGRMINGAGAVLLLALCATGIVIWWPGVAGWRRGVGVDFRRAWRRVNWELHSATGIWTVTLIAMWAVSGLYFAFPTPFRNAVHAISPLTVVAVPQSDPSQATRFSRPSGRDLIARARAHVPDQAVARVVPPVDDTAAFVVMFSPVTPVPEGQPALTSVYLDQYIGARLPDPAPAAASVGDLIMRWLAPLHVGNFGGIGLKIVWLVLGLAPPLLFATGFLMWWTRVVRPRVSRDD